VDPKDCALIIGITYFISAILSLILKAPAWLQQFRYNI
jgi:hypothetical protein